MADSYKSDSTGTTTEKSKRRDPRLLRDTTPKTIIVNKEFFGQSWLDPQTSTTMYGSANYTTPGFTPASYQQYPQASYNYTYPGGYTQSGYDATQQETVVPTDQYQPKDWVPVQQPYGAPAAQPAAVAPSQVVTPAPLSVGESEGVLLERKQQHSQLVKQREEYVRKAAVLRRELDLLRNQKDEILSENSSQRDMEPILKENHKLQEEIQNKMKAIGSVVDMLSSIIKDGMSMSDLERSILSETNAMSQPYDASSTVMNKNKGVVHNPPAQNYLPQQYQLRGNARGAPTSSYSTTDGGNNLLATSSVMLDNTSTTAKYNYMHYDPELHWCRICDEFPKTAKDLLLHLQSDRHRQMMNENDVGDNTPWHKLTPEPELPAYENAPKKRIPIRGLQFFMATPAWYCKLCDTWIGDLHCASHHLKSQAHFQNYANFVDQNPHWEIEWLKDREKAMNRRESTPSSGSDSNDARTSARSQAKKTKKNTQKGNKRLMNDAMVTTSKDKRRRKRRAKKHHKHSNTSESSSSSSSSNSSSEEEQRSRKSYNKNGNHLYRDGGDKDEKSGDPSKSIRVVMRNMKVQSIMSEDLSSKWQMLERFVDEQKKKEVAAAAQNNAVRREDDQMLSQWMNINSSLQNSDKEKLMLSSLKDRMKVKQDQEKVKWAEIDRKRKETERAEREEKEKRVKEVQEQRERLERDRRDKERQEYERIRDKERESVRFKTTRDRERDRDRDYQRHYRESHPRRRGRSSSSDSREPSEERYRKDDHSPRSNRRSRSEEERDYHRRPTGHPTSHTAKPSTPKPLSPQRPPPPTTTAATTPTAPNNTPTVTKARALPCIGRMPFFKNKTKVEEKVTIQQLQEKKKDIKKEEYDVPRRTRFQPGNLPRAFLPSPDVVCYPKLSSIPPLPPPPTVVEKEPEPPEPPTIREVSTKPPKAPPAPKIGVTANNTGKVSAKTATNTPNTSSSSVKSKVGFENTVSAEVTPVSSQMDDNIMNNYYDYEYSMMYSDMYAAQQGASQGLPPAPPPPEDPQPPAPPMNDLSQTTDSTDDLAMLGICADDMAAQSL